MATVIIDGAPAAPPIAAKTFGDLLAAVDGRLEARRRVVTIFRIDGVEVPAFRDPALTRTPAAGIGRVEIDSATPEELATGCLHEAAQAFAALAAAADRAALEYRMEDLPAASGTVVALTEGIGTALAVTGAASLGLGVDVTRLRTADGTIAELTEAVSRSLETLIGAQQGADWAAAARELSDGLVPLLRRWGRTCAAIDLSRPA